ncbi:MAG: hypothetical protein NTY19_23925 [Planctomycetota bacterium]|nr:hypothetical protein [Planctomycetota bacterium]
MSLLVVLLTGVFTIVYGQVWVVARNAIKVDAILSRDEVQDPTLVGVVTRALAYKSRGETDAVYAVAGVVIACPAVLGLLAFGRFCRTLDEAN